MQQVQYSNNDGRNNINPKLVNPEKDNAFTSTMLENINYQNDQSAKIIEKTLKETEVMSDAPPPMPQNQFSQQNQYPPVQPATPMVRPQSQQNQYPPIQPVAQVQQRPQTQQNQYPSNQSQGMDQQSQQNQYPPVQQVTQMQQPQKEQFTMNPNMMQPAQQMEQYPQQNNQKPNLDYPSNFNFLKNGNNLKKICILATVSFLVCFPQVQEKINLFSENKRVVAGISAILICGGYFGVCVAAKLY